MPVITLTTDFGSLYPASLKAVILSIEPGAQIVDITHSIPPADIRAGAFALYSVAGYFPAGTVHVAVVDPGVGTSRKAIVIHSGGQYFVGPDNGLMVPAARSMGDPEVYEITNKELLGPVSSTFHGRDIFARMGALIAKGMNVREAGIRITDFVDLDLSDAVILDDHILAEVIYTDDFGNVILNIPARSVPQQIPPGAILQVAGRSIAFLQTYDQVPVGEMICLTGSHGFLEIAVNQGSAAEILGLHNGDRVSIEMRSYRISPG